MPHSTGGGSHSGGFHSGGSHSSFHSTGGGSHSGGYHSSSSSSGYSGSSYRSASSYSSPRPIRVKPRVSQQHFAGATRYVYYRNSVPQYVYSNYEHLTREKYNGRLILYTILVLMIIIAYVDLFTPPAKLDNQFHRNIVIEDNLRVIEDQTALETSLQAFYDTTGIAPAVITVTNESWNRYYQSLSSKAYDLYVNHFRNEQHWLIVYSEPTIPDPAFLDWSWEGVAGDDTSGILTYDVVYGFGKQLQRYLTDERVGVGEAISRAIDELTATVMNTSEYDASDIPAALLIVVGVAALGLWRSGYWPVFVKRPAEIPKDAVPDTPKAEPAQKPTQAVCDYCGSILPADAIKCPSCGAAKTSFK